jgi:hypothetical protein
MKDPPTAEEAERWYMASFIPSPPDVNYNNRRTPPTQILNFPGN